MHFIYGHITLDALVSFSAIVYMLVTVPTAGSTTTTKSSFTKEVNLGTGVFAKGKAYKFTFTITLNAIEIAVTDNLDWNTDENKPITVN